MTKWRATWHDGSFVDGHCVFGVISHYSMSRFMIGCDHLIPVVNLHTPALWAWTNREEKVRKESLDQSINPHHMLQRLSCTSLLVSPIRILSFANSSSFMVTRSFPSAAAFSAAWFTRFSSSAPEKPTVPLAMISALTATKHTQTDYFTGLS